MKSEQIIMIIYECGCKFYAFYSIYRNGQDRFMI